MTTETKDSLAQPSVIQHPSALAPARLSQKQRILAFMGDGEWHTTYDMKHAPGGPEIGYPLCRKEELEREGYVFDSRWHEGSQQKEWRLVRRLDGTRPGEHKPEPVMVRRPLRVCASGNAQPVGVGAAEKEQGTLFP